MNKIILIPGMHDVSEPERWLNLKAAAEMLGIHPTTLRRWTDQKAIRCLRTPGGHRRFLKRDLDAFLEARGPMPAPQMPEALIQSLIHRTRSEMSMEQVDAQPWHAMFDENGRAARRESGRRLLGLALQYTLRQAGREAALQEGQQIGWEYGDDAARRGLSIADTVRALFFFRETLIRSAQPGVTVHGQVEPADIHIHRSLREFLDEVVYAALEGYEQALPKQIVGHERP